MLQSKPLTINVFAFMISIGSVFGFIVGATLGLTGAGGGILAVPALVFGMGLSMTAAAPIALIAVGLAAFTGAIDGLRRQVVRYKAAFIMSLVGGLSSSLGVRLATYLSEFWLKILFAAVMLTVAKRMYHQAKPALKKQSVKPAKNYPCLVSEQTGKFVWTPLCFITIATIGASAGLLTGLLGVGGGLIIVPLLQRFTNLPMHNIVATSLLVVALVSATTVLNALATADALPIAAWPFILLVIIGMLFGRYLAPKLTARFIQISFALLCSLSALFVLSSAF